MVIWSLFDGSGIMGLPWAMAGHQVFCFNLDDADHGDYAGVKVSHKNIHYIDMLLGPDMSIDDFEKRGFYRPALIMAFPPCTDIAVSGAAHFERKEQESPGSQLMAVELAKLAAKIADSLSVPYMIENPVSVLSTKWRKPDFSFHPWEFGGYLPEDDTHPNFPEYIAPRDAYPKKTCLWTGNGFNSPEKKPVHCPDGYSAQHKKLGGKSTKTKMIRSLTPRGFARAVFEFNQ